MRNPISKLIHDDDSLVREDPPTYAHAVPLDRIEKGRWERSWPTIACGAGLFSDGYLNGYDTLNIISSWNLTDFV